MKTLQVVFTDKEFTVIKRAREKLWNKNKKVMNWRQYLLQTARAINNVN